MCRGVLISGVSFKRSSTVYLCKLLYCNNYMQFLIMGPLFDSYRLFSALTVLLPPSSSSRSHKPPSPPLPLPRSSSPSGLGHRPLASWKKTRQKQSRILTTVAFVSERSPLLPPVPKPGVEKARKESLPRASPKLGVLAAPIASHQSPRTLPRRNTRVCGTRTSCGVRHSSQDSPQ